MTTTTKNAPQTETYEPVIAPQIEKIVKGFANVGKLWASHGLAVGQQTLETSAKTLQVAAETVKSVKERLNTAQ